MIKSTDMTSNSKVGLKKNLPKEGNYKRRLMLNHRLHIRCLNILRISRNNWKNCGKCFFCLLLLRNSNTRKSRRSWRLLLEMRSNRYKSSVNQRWRSMFQTRNNSKSRKVFQRSGTNRLQIQDGRSVSSNKKKILLHLRCFRSRRIRLRRWITEKVVKLKLHHLVTSLNKQSFTARVARVCFWRRVW